MWKQKRRLWERREWRLMEKVVPEERASEKDRTNKDGAAEVMVVQWP